MEMAKTLTQSTTQQVLNKNVMNEWIIAPILEILSWETNPRQDWKKKNYLTVICNILQKA